MRANIKTTDERSSGPAWRRSQLDQSELCERRRARVGKFFQCHFLPAPWAHKWGPASSLGLN